MGLFLKFKKSHTDSGSNKNSDLLDTIVKSAEKGITPLKNNNHNCFDEPLDKLTKDGELPFGWVSAHPDVLEKEKPIKDYIDRYVYLIKQNAPVDQQIDNLKKLVEYIELFKNYCYSKDECYIYYFASSYEHCHNSRSNNFSLVDSYKDRLQELLDNYGDIKNHQELQNTIETDLLHFLKENNPILQKDIYKSFDSALKSDIQSLLYYWQKEGKIIREKQGNTYIVIINN
uniref:hypothetical protein n=1 Tax=Eubacterium sp. TaxID=142586 RepID=UPI00402893D8